MAIPTDPPNPRSTTPEEFPFRSSAEHVPPTNLDADPDDAPRTPSWSDTARTSAVNVPPTSEQKTGPANFARFVRDTASSQLENQKHRASRGLGSVASAVRHSTDKLRAAGQEGFAGYVNQAADRIDDFARGLENKGFEEIVQNAETFARRHPAIFIGGAFGLGLLGGRFLKSSKSRGGVPMRATTGSQGSRPGHDDRMAGVQHPQRAVHGRFAAR